MDAARCDRPVPGKEIAGLPKYEQWCLCCGREADLASSGLSIGPKGDTSSLLSAQLLGQVNDAYRDHIKIAGFRSVRHAGRTTAVLVRTVDETRS